MVDRVAHAKMVPFWRRRLLAVTLPGATLVGGLFVAGLITTIDWLRWQVQDPSVRLPVAPGEALMMVALVAPFPLVAVLSIYAAVPRNSLRTGYWTSRTLITLHGILAVVACAAGFALVFDYFFFESPWLFFIWAVPGASTGVIALLIRTGHIRPRSSAIQAAASRAALASLAVIALTAPALILFWAQSGNSESIVALGSSAVLSVAVLQSSILLPWLAANLCVAFFARELSRRHTPYHTTHCHDCGYDLTTLEADTCPECGVMIHENQKLAIASFSQSNGNHSTESPPS